MSKVKALNLKLQNKFPKIEGGLLITAKTKANELIQEKTTIPQTTTTSRFTKRIGSVTYEVEIHFKQGATETMDKKIMRLIKNEMGAAV